MGYKWTFKSRVEHFLLGSAANKPAYLVPETVEEAKREALRHVAVLEDCRRQNYGSGTNGVHDLHYNGLRLIAVNCPLFFAQWIADGDIPMIYESLLSLRPGAAHPLYPGVLDILLNSGIDEVRKGAEWLEGVYERNGYER